MRKIGGLEGWISNRVTTVAVGGMIQQFMPGSRFQSKNRPDCKIDLNQRMQCSRGASMQLSLNLKRVRTLAAGVALACTGFAATAHAQSTVTCPERVATAEATLAQPTQAAGFQPVTAGKDSPQQAFLQNVAVYAGPGAGAPVQGADKGPKRVEWTFDGNTEVSVACVFEGGVVLTRAVGKPKACAATVLRSKGAKDAGGWGMENAAFTCR